MSVAFLYLNIVHNINDDPDTYSNKILQIQIELQYNTNVVPTYLLAGFLWQQLLPAQNHYQSW